MQLGAINFTSTLMWNTCKPSEYRHINDMLSSGEACILLEENREEDLILLMTPNGSVGWIVSNLIDRFVQK